MFFLVLKIFVFFYVLMLHGSNLNISAFCALLTLIINNFNDQNLTKFEILFNTCRLMKKKSAF